MKLVVCGGRTFKDALYVVGVLDGIHRLQPITVLIHGAAPGADTHASHWAWLRGVQELVYPADWKAHGKAAGPIRNQQMVNAGPSLCVAFPGGKGTDNMKDRARAHGVRVLEFSPTTLTTFANAV